METAEVLAAAPDAAESEVAAVNGTAEEEDAADAAAAVAYSWPQLRFDLPPLRLYHFARQFRSPCSFAASNFLKGVKWSPDGSSFLTSSDDNSLRMFYQYAHLSYPRTFYALSRQQLMQVRYLLPFSVRPEDAYSTAAEHTAETPVGGEGGSFFSSMAAGF